MSTFIPLKQCTSCLRCIPTSMFPTSKRTKDGYHSWCKDCRADLSRRIRETKFGPPKRPKNSPETILNLNLQNRLQLIRLFSRLPAEALIYDITNRISYPLKITHRDTASVTLSFKDQSWTISANTLDEVIPVCMKMLHKDAYRLEPTASSLHVAITEYFYL